MAVTEIRITAKLNGVALPHYPLTRRLESGGQPILNDADYASDVAGTQLNIINTGTASYQLIAQRVLGQRVLFGICGSVSLDAVKPKLDDRGAIITTLSSVAGSSAFFVVLTEEGSIRVQGGAIAS